MFSVLFRRYHFPFSRIVNKFEWHKIRWPTKCLQKTVKLGVLSDGLGFGNVHSSVELYSLLFFNILCFNGVTIKYWMKNSLNVSLGDRFRSIDPVGRIGVL